MNNQVKNDETEVTKDLNLDQNFTIDDLEVLRQIGDIAREFQSEYNAIKDQETESTYQRTK